MAAEFYFKSLVGGELALYLNTDGQSVNSVAGVLAWPDELNIQSVNASNSVVNFWLEEPRLNDGRSTVNFSGITPGGYSGNQGQILALTLDNNKNKTGLIRSTNLEARHNDGLGTPVTLKSKQIEYSIEAATIAVPIDNEPPEEFIVSLGQDVSMFNGQWFVVFQATDKGSCLTGYEILESRWRLGAKKLDLTQKWQPARSPQLLIDQELESFIYVRANDRAGYSRLESFSPINTAWYQVVSPWLILLGVIIICFCFLVGKKYFSRRSLFS